MDIKKIIREELDNSFKWVNNIEPVKPELTWLKNKFSNLTEVDKGGVVYYVDSDKYPLFYYYSNETDKVIYVNYWRIWSPLKQIFHLNEIDIHKLLSNWLWSSYGIIGFEIQGSDSFFFKKIIREELENPLNWMDDIEPMSPSLVWLKDNFNNLIKTINQGSHVYYGLTPNDTILYYDETDPDDGIYVSYDKIWTVLESRFHLSYEEIREVIKKWLSQDYDLTGLKPHF